MEENNYPPVFSETAPSKTVVDEDFHDLESLRENMLNSLESMEPRIDSLQQTFDILLKQSDNSSMNFGADIMNEINQILPRMKNIHNNSISSARKIQALSLSQQTVQTLSIPKQMRPVHDEFFAFKDEFDLSLKNVASLSRNVTEKSDIIASTVNPIKDIPKQINELMNEISQQTQATKENNKYISKTKSELFQGVLGAQQSLAQEFEQKIGLAETILNQMMNKAENGVDNSEKMKKILKQRQDDVKTSFNNLMTEIKKTTESKLDDLDKIIQRRMHDTKKEIKKLELGFISEIQEMEKLPIPEMNYSESDETEKEKEMSELDILIERFNNLSKLIKQANSRVEGNDFEDHEGEWEGREVIFRCFDDGTFKIIEKETKGQQSPQPIEQDIDNVDKKDVNDDETQNTENANETNETEKTREQNDKEEDNQSKVEEEENNESNEDDADNANEEEDNEEEDDDENEDSKESEESASEDENENQ